MPVTQKKPKKKPSKKSQRKHVDDLARAAYRKDYCEAMGLDGVKCGGPLEWAHIETRAILGMRYEEWNQLTLCAGHHRYYTTRSIMWRAFLNRHHPAKLRKVEAWLRRSPLPKFEGYSVWSARLRSYTGP